MSASARIGGFLKEKELPEFIRMLVDDAHTPRCGRQRAELPETVDVYRSSGGGSYVLIPGGEY